MAKALLVDADAVVVMDLLRRLVVVVVRLPLLVSFPVKDSVSVAEVGLWLHLRQSWHY